MGSASPQRPSSVTSGKRLDSSLRGIMTAPTLWAWHKGSARQHMRTAQGRAGPGTQELRNAHSFINQQEKIQIIILNLKTRLTVMIETPGRVSRVQFSSPWRGRLPPASCRLLLHLAPLPPPAPLAHPQETAGRGLPLGGREHSGDENGWVQTLAQAPPDWMNSGQRLNHPEPQLPHP